MEKEKILIVDDDINIVILIRLHLELEGYDIFAAHNGDMALDMIASHMPDLVLLDIMMPKMNGWEVCKRIKENKETSHIPVIMLTAKSGREDLKRGLESGVVDYITKPFSPFRLVEVVNKVLQEKKLHSVPPSSDKKNEKSSVATNIAIVGSSNEGMSILQFLLGDNRVNIKGVADVDINSPIILLAKKLNIFATTNITELLQLQDLQLIFMLSDDLQTINLIDKYRPPWMEVVRDKTSGFIWYLIEQRTELEEKERSLLKELNDRVNELSNLNKELEILYEGSRLLGSAIDMSSTVNTSIEIMAKAVNADSGIVVLLDEETEEWTVHSSFKFPLELIKDRDIDLLQGIGKSSLKLRNPIIIEDVSIDKKRTFLSEIPDIFSTIALPLFIKNNAFGIVYLNHNKIKEYTQDEIYILSTLSSQASVALDNARLYETVKQKHQAVEQLLTKLMESKDGDSGKSIDEIQRKFNLSINDSIKSMEVCYNSLISTLNQARFHIDEIKKVSDENLNKLQRFPTTVLSPPLEKMDLMPSIEEHLKEFQAETGIVAELIFSGLKRKLGESIETTIYSIILEAMKNVKEHSKASNLRIRIKVLSDQFNVAIEDDGIGFDQLKVPFDKQMGINTMKEKSSFLGGVFKIRSQPGRGTVVLLRIPIPTEPDNGKPE